ncbi:hypothetical protein MiSe_37130 [Microseira wollei NIES-4236]|uniref:Secreted protein n=1 Tax=Microseira wollei NIES-4236 TaxID=2530354 RepID=A0AAV3XC15_9CYAN|nr:hypothetical protein MiSe_37130 [Microseira wollei NIES-4236]
MISCPVASVASARAGLFITWFVVGATLTKYLVIRSRGVPLNGQVLLAPTLVKPAPTIDNQSDMINRTDAKKQMRSEKSWV